MRDFEDSTKREREREIERGLPMENKVQVLADNVSKASAALEAMLKAAKVGFQQDQEEFISSPGGFLGN